MKNLVRSAMKTLAPRLLLMAFFFIGGSYSAEIAHFLRIDIWQWIPKFIHYSSWTLFWLACASFVNASISIFIWKRLVQTALGEPVPRLLTDITSVVIYLIAVTVIIGSVFQKDATGIWATSGAVGLMLGFALRNMILDIFTGLAINIERSYKIGDWLKVQNKQGEAVGQVVEINWRATRLLTEEGNYLIMPNSVINMAPILNYTSPEPVSRFEIVVCLDYAVHTERAHRIFQAALKEVSLQQGFSRTKPYQVLIEKNDEFGTHYLLRFWLYPWQPLAPSQGIGIAESIVLKHLRQAGITPAYPKSDTFYARMPKRNLNVLTLSDRVALLKRIEIFSPLGKEDLVLLAKGLHPISVENGSVLFQQGDEGASMFVIVEGLFEVTHDAQKPEYLTPGDFFGEMSLLTGASRSASMKAIADSVVYEIEKDMMQKLFDSNPKLLEKISHTVEERQEHWKQNALNEDDNSISSTFANKESLIHRIRDFFSLD